MSLHERLSEYVRAAFTGIWIESHEHEDALAEISQLCGQEKWRLAIWDLEQGLRTGGTPSTNATDPLAAIRAAASLLPSTVPPQTTTSCGTPPASKRMGRCGPTSTGLSTSTS